MGIPHILTRHCTTIMLSVQQQYLDGLRSGKTEQLTTEARRNDLATHARLKQLMKQPHNSECADCTATRPGWAALPHGVFVCIDCAQLHRGIGRHISQVKAINTGTYLWYPHEAAVMEQVGNKVARELCMGAAPSGISKPDRDAPTSEKLAFVKSKYEQKRWVPTDVARKIAVAEQANQKIAVAEPANQKIATVEPTKPMTLNLMGEANLIRETQPKTAKSNGDDNQWAQWDELASSEPLPSFGSAIHKDPYQQRKSSIMSLYQQHQQPHPSHASCKIMVENNNCMSSTNNNFFAAYGL